MKKPNAPISDTSLWQTLNQFDPVDKSSQGSLVMLEERILADFDRDYTLPKASVFDISLPVWMLGHGRIARSAAFASVIIVAFGFIVGQLSVTQVKSSAATSNNSLIAFAENSTVQPASTTETSWGDDDEDSE